MFSNLIKFVKNLRENKIKKNNFNIAAVIIFAIQLEKLFSDNSPWLTEKFVLSSP